MTAVMAGQPTASQLSQSLQKSYTHVVHAAQDAAVCRLGEEKLLLVQDAERGRWQVLAAKIPGDQTGQLAHGTQTRCRHVGLEDREECARMGRKQAFPATEPQKISVPAFASIP